MCELGYLVVVPQYEIVFVFSRIVEEDYLKILPQVVAS